MKSSPHRHTAAVINLENIAENINRVRGHLPGQPELWAVVKANAYGHGAVRVARHIHDMVEGFCVSNLDEALELRQHLITQPLLVLSGIVPANVDLARANGISLTCPSLEWLELIIEEHQDLTGLKVHVKVDSGMGRIGMRSADEVNQVIRLLDQEGMQFEGLFTHFATADEANPDKFEQQRQTFDNLVSQLERRPRYIHSTNSAAALWHSEQVGDIERLGIGMYGLNPSGEAIELPYELKPALSLVSELTHVSKIPKGETVGYGATYELAEDSYVGTVSIGYADGWTRDMQGFYVLVNGKKAEIIGRVSMDQMTIKLDKDYKIGTPVTLIGRDGDEEITAQDIANWRKTIAYEVVCLLSDRIYRKYIG
ncbi:alanine racemase [Lactococcus termiticola]|uniref:Alanine racemase n=1 Tax=Lactococcus termiticola TaxID=2169526 RepID=A0A2R5HJ78_9LACT|nr:alanine racemase [Lactococcus termiticola]GBG96231.1 alanine racemase [Lactococcus termiticola]